jgi:hypothetical protein
MKTRVKLNWDVLGITTAVACAIHCALLPLFLSSLPLFGINIIHNIYFEAGMITLAFAVGSFSLFHGFRKHHHQILPLLVFAAGFILLVMKQFFVLYETWLLLPAALLIITAHFLNYLYCRKANHCHVDDCDH